MNKNRSKIWVFILSLILLFSLSSCEKEFKLPEASDDFYVYDEVGIMNRDVKDYIIVTNKELYKKTGAQIVVASIDSLENQDIETYALNLYEKWKIGSREYDNGVLILIAPEEGLIWIEIGYGLEGQLVDSKVKRIIDNYMIPNFAIEEYSKGILLGFNEILGEVQEEYKITLDKYDKIDDSSISEQGYNDKEIIFPNIFMIIGVIIFLLIDFKIFRGTLMRSILYGLGRRGPSGGYKGGSSGRSDGSSGGGGRSGGGGAGGKW